MTVRTEATDPLRRQLLNEIREAVDRMDGLQADKAVVLGVSRPILANLLNERKPFSLDYLIALAEKLGIEVKLQISRPGTYS